MEVLLSFLVAAAIVSGVLAVLYEFRLRQPDVLVLNESAGRIGVRKSRLYPRHLSLALKKTSCPIQTTVEATTAGNLGVRVKLIGSAALSLENVESLIQAGGWNSEAVARAAADAQVMIEGLVRECAENAEIPALSSASIAAYLNERIGQTKQRFGIEIVSIAIQSLEPTDALVANALRQQEQARLTEQTERLNHQARVAAAKAKFQADEEITAMEHSIELKKLELKRVLLEQESMLARRRLEDELAANRMRLAFESEELELLKTSPELLMLTPQAARLAEASQSLKNARTVISLAPQEMAHGTELLGLFQNLLQEALEAKKEAKVDAVSL